MEWLAALIVGGCIVVGICGVVLLVALMGASQKSREEGWND
jgi:hypothetical protein